LGLFFASQSRLISRIPFQIRHLHKLESALNWLCFVEMPFRNTLHAIRNTSSIGFVLQNPLFRISRRRRAIGFVFSNLATDFTDSHSFINHERTQINGIGIPARPVLSAVEWIVNVKVPQFSYYSTIRLPSSRILTTVFCILFSMFVKYYTTKH